ncbi:MAG: pyruvate kinase [Parcubacteria group bacterium]
MKRTKIVATIGPASSSKNILKKMIESGMNVARINFSHGTYAANSELIKSIREISEKMDIPIGIMADLQGPRIRTLADDDVEIKKGETVMVSDISVRSRLPIVKYKFFKLDSPGIIKTISLGNSILIEDGLMRVKVIQKSKDYLLAEVIEGGIIKNHKGVNIPDAKLKIGAVTKKDERDLKFALKSDVDFIALSFVSNRKEIESIKKKIKKILGRNDDLPQIVAKIERKEAIKNIDEIISATDILMVARGDLGIEMDESRVVIYQKDLIARCLKAGKPVIVATQMLNSMIENPRPTRAEVSDVSNAVIDHADAVMLSGESASGKYPVEAVRTMRDIIERTEESPFDDLIHGFLGDSKSSVSAAVANSAHELSKDSGARAIVVASRSGFTAHMIARHRPMQSIFVITNSEKTHNQLSILWGTESFVLKDCKTLDDLITRSVDILTKKKLLKKKDRVVIVTGRPHVKREHMSLVKVEEIK